MTSERAKITNGGLVAMTKVLRAYEVLNDNVIPPGVNNYVQPVTQADRMLEKVLLFEETVDLTAGGSVFVAGFTVPAGKRRVLIFIGRGGSTGATQLSISDLDSRLAISNASTSTEKTTAVSLPMEPGWRYGMVSTGNPADSAVFIQAIFVETDAFLS